MELRTAAGERRDGQDRPPSPARGRQQQLAHMREGNEEVSGELWVNRDWQAASTSPSAQTAGRLTPPSFHRVQ